MKRYRHIFFDLDHTLWDFDAGSLDTMKEVFEVFGLEGLGIPGINPFLEQYHRINKDLWNTYREGNIAKEVLNYRRFQESLLCFGVDDTDLSARIAMYYITRLPYKNYFYPFVEEILQYLFPLYKLHVITNGFEEVQKIKISHSFLQDYIDTLITSEDAGYKKPDLRIFRYALLKTGAEAGESLMIGDDPVVDIDGARDAGIDQVLFNPAGTAHDSLPTWEISSLLELKRIL